MGQTPMVRQQPTDSVFDAAADRYHHARPRYPGALWDRVFAGPGLPSRPIVLEIGPATGVATEQMANRCRAVTALEPGPRLRAAAVSNLARFPHVHVVPAAYESWDPPRWGSFDMVVAATAWHWTDPAVRFQLAHRHLRAEGRLAFWSSAHVFADDGDPFFAELQEVYDEIGEGLEPDAPFPRPGELPDQRATIEASGLFAVEAIEHHHWQTTHDAESYIELLGTFSGHITMEPWQREHLFEAIRKRLAQRPDGRLVRGWGAVLHIARAKGAGTITA